MNVSITDIRDFLECRRKGYLNKMYRPAKPQDNLWFGNVIHAGLDAYYSKGNDAKAGLKAMKTFAEKSLAEMQNEFAPVWVEFSDKFHLLWELGWQVFNNYVDYDAHEPIQGKVIGVEKYYKMPLTNKINLTGRIDLIVETKQGVWVVDHKTASKPLESQALDVDDQLTGYAYLVWKSLGVIPIGVLFNTLVKSAPVPPAELKKGGLSRAVDQPTTPALYRGKLKELGLPENDYTDILRTLGNKGWTRFFIREGGTRNQHELEAFERRAYLKAAEIQQAMTEPKTFAYPSGSIYRCGYCPFVAVCKSMDDGGDAESLLESRFIKIK